MDDQERRRVHQDRQGHSDAECRVCRHPGLGLLVDASVDRDAGRSDVHCRVRYLERDRGCLLWALEDARRAL